MVPLWYLSLGIVVIYKFNAETNIAYYTFFKMYHSCIVHIMDYGSGIREDGNFDAGIKIELRAIWYCFRVHPKTPILSLLEEDMGCNSCIKVIQHINMVVYETERIIMVVYETARINMDDNRLTKMVVKVGLYM